VNWLSGQDRRAWLDQQDERLGNALRYYLGPAAAPVNALATVGSWLSPGADMMDMVQSGGDLMGSRGGWDAAQAAAGLGAATLGMAIPGTAKGIEEAAETGIRAYHGSPHNYKAERLIEWPDGRQEYIEGLPDVLPDIPQGARSVKDFPLGRQRLDKIGSGEGAQAYGHGLYEAESEGVAKSYKESLADALSVDGKPIMMNGRRIASTGSPEVDDLLISFRGDINKSVKELEDTIVDIGSLPQSAANDGLIEKLRGEIGLLDSLRGRVKNENLGHMYEVRINADPDDFLDWDKPLSEQSEKVRKSLADNWLAHPEAHANQTGRETYMQLPSDYVPTADQARERATAKLREAGIPGIRYLDQGSRVGGDADAMVANYGSREKALEIAEQRFKSASFGDLKYWDKIVNDLKTPQSRNYVVFDDKLIEIMKKYGWMLPTAGVGLSFGSDE
jgi:hypothetical protein